MSRKQLTLAAAVSFTLVFAGLIGTRELTTGRRNVDLIRMKGGSVHFSTEPRIAGIVLPHRFRCEPLCEVEVVVFAHEGFRNDDLELLEPFDKLHTLVVYDTLIDSSTISKFESTHQNIKVMRNAPRAKH